MQTFTDLSISILGVKNASMVQVHILVVTIPKGLQDKSEVLQHEIRELQYANIQYFLL